MYPLHAVKITQTQRCGFHCARLKNNQVDSAGYETHPPHLTDRTGWGNLPRCVADTME